MAQRIGFFLLEGYALMSTAAAMEPLRAANLFNPDPLYEIIPISRHGGPINASLPGHIDTIPLAQAGHRFDLVFVVAGGNPLRVHDANLFTWLRQLDRANVPLGGISGGSALLARAGLMQNRRFTIHWHHLEDMRAQSADYLLERRLYVIDRDRYTCAGGAAPLDMMYAMISARHGSSFARKISDWFIQTEIRVSNAPQQASVTARYGPLPHAVQEAVEMMESHIADPLDLSQIADLVALSPRQLQRQFSNALSQSVMQTYRVIRLETAKDLLTNTRMPVADIAHMTGFASHTSFTNAYHTHFHETPAATRNNAFTSASKRRAAPNNNLKNNRRNKIQTEIP
ncbi:GlxA family transcriptional regulator [Epibacterium ulvae]|uniref:GlxA family transcriptional regulator n=1 Tax=Epibacterium ulvae TaxID=1156985 RepID=UPI00248F4C38|nr:GlxA family transcriptional regulator [Epibacterium ulvae]